MLFSVRRAALSRVALPLAALLIAAPLLPAQSLLPSTLGISAQVHGVGGTMNTAI